MTNEDERSQEKIDEALRGMTIEEIIARLPDDRVEETLLGNYVEMICGKKMVLIGFTRVAYYEGIGMFFKNNPKSITSVVAGNFFSVPRDPDEFEKMIKNKKAVAAFKKGVSVIGSDGNQHKVTEIFNLEDGEKFFAKLLWKEN
ncbi:hypothetical protein KAJ41_00335 [Candidatus Parcubacteria bacterium]|nr:hypothetical protein [Candidatus Parcubacteria bacterium]